METPLTGSAPSLQGDLAELVRRAQGGDREAMGGLLGMFRGAMWATALAATGRRDHAEDALQDAAVEAMRALPSLRDPARACAWLCTLARRSAWRVRRRARRVEELPLPEPQENHPGYEDPERVWEALARVADRDREVFLMRHLERCSYEEIGLRVGLSARGVETCLYRVRLRLQEGLSR
ncbi:MAG: RNA polymerase sigma factor [Planctomycetes bacterium]|nr:RNA polymerase sigma factor [Planctomycetota bacterium]